MAQHNNAQTLKVLAIKKTSEFQSIGKSKNKFHAKTLLVIAKETPEEYLQNRDEGKNAANFIRIGFTVSKIVGNAVNRNLAKRRLREAFRSLFLQYCNNHNDYIIIAKKEISSANYQKILKDLSFCLKNLKNIIPSQIEN